MKVIKILQAVCIGCALFALSLPAMALSLGDKAPEFSAASTQGEISLADYRGEKNVVLALYFAVFTSV